MFKKLLMITFIMFLLNYIPSKAQEYDRKIKITIVVKRDTTVSNHLAIIQELSFNQPQNFDYFISDKIGFEFDLDNQTDIRIGGGCMIDYGIYEKSVSFQSKKMFSNLNSRVLTPIILPPDEEDIQEGDNEVPQEPDYPFTPKNTVLNLGANAGIKTIKIKLLKNGELIHEISQKFKVSSHEITPISSFKVKKENLSDVNLYPNPLGAHLYINTKKEKRVGENTKAIIEIYTIQGILLKKSTLNSINNKVTLFYDFTQASESLNTIKA